MAPASVDQVVINIDSCNSFLSRISDSVTQPNAGYAQLKPRAQSPAHPEDRGEDISPKLRPSAHEAKGDEIRLSVG